MARTPLLLALAATAAAHVCLLRPEQRTGLPKDLSQLAPGDDACFHPYQCPTRAPGGPITAVPGGLGLDVLLQQNLNHYNPGEKRVLGKRWERAMQERVVGAAVRATANSERRDRALWVLATRC